jgi:hypothetical protein
MTASVPDPEPIPTADAAPVGTGWVPKLSDDVQYAVYLHDSALEALGEAIKPFLTQGPNGPHLVCTEFDTGGALCEMTVETAAGEGAKQRTEIMFPVAMIRLVMSLPAVADGFGFRTRG